MKAKLKFGEMFLFTSLLLWGVSCTDVMGLNEDSTSSESSSSSSSTETTEEPTSLLVSEMGGYDTEDEEVAFGSDDFEEEDFEEDESIEDPTITEDEEAEMEAETASAEEEPSTVAEEDSEAEAEEDSEENVEADSAQESEEGYNIYMVHLLWGNLELNTPENLLGEELFARFGDKYAVWDGSVSLEGSDNGGIMLKRRVLFDQNDSILPDDDRQSVAWESSTGPHIDGVLLKVFVPLDADESEVSLVIDTESYTQEILLADLNEYNEIETINEDGVGIAIAAFKRERDGCEHGFVTGKYFSRPGQHGGHIFRGKSVNAAGELSGHLRGHFGRDDEGDQVFFGKYIDDRGHFQGRLFGTYADGAFDGMWYDKSSLDVGTINGKYVVGDEVNSGFFQGLWSETCTE